MSKHRFRNPLPVGESLGDPFVLREQDAFHLTGTVSSEDRLVVWRSPKLTELGRGERVEVWRATPGGTPSAQIWAPELHRFGGRWRLYFTGSDGRDEGHRHYVLEAQQALGPYAEAGPVDPHHDAYAIDGSVLNLSGELYWLYAAQDGLWAAAMESPTRAARARVRIAVGDQEWERAWVPAESGGWRRADFHWIEAPQPLLRGGRLFVVYSAGHSATAQYALGLLECRGRVLDPNAWVKHPGPVFAPVRDGPRQVLTVGHASFTTSPDEAEDWIVYHAKDNEDADFSGRTPRAQRFGWSPDGLPVFGRPTPTGLWLDAPSGE